MGDKSAIEWTDATWNPVLGCTKVSPGCQHCYAIRVAHRLEHNFDQAAYQGLTTKHTDGSLNWTGAVHFLPERLEQPLKWTKPRRIFVNSMADLFHDDLPDSFIDQVFAVMALAPQHTFQVLTKRPERMRRYFGPIGQVGRSDFVFAAIGRQLNASRVKYPQWPLPNVWLGVSTEDQATADERIPFLMETPAAVRWISAEPLLGRLHLSPYLKHYCPNCHRLHLEHMIDKGITELHHKHICQYCGGWWDTRYRGFSRENGLDWVVVGGESGGPQERRLVSHLGNQLSGEIWTPTITALDWVTQIQYQCNAAQIPFLFKQWGGPTPHSGGRTLEGQTWDQYPVGDYAPGRGW